MLGEAALMAHVTSLRRILSTGSNQMIKSNKVDMVAKN